MNDKEIIKSFFKTAGYSKLWDSTEKWSHDQPKGSIIVSIKENEDWNANCCVLSPNFFDREKMKAAGWDYDCKDYGVFIFIRSTKKEILLPG